MDRSRRTPTPVDFPAEDVSALGARLRAAREAKGVDREAASRHAGIPMRYLEMLEEGRFPAVADPAYLTHFLRRYALWLRLDAEAIARDFLAETEPDSSARRAGRLPPEAPERRATPFSRPFSLVRVVYAALLLAALAGVFAVARFEQRRQSAATDTASTARPAGSSPAAARPPLDGIAEAPAERSAPEWIDESPGRITAGAPAPLTSSPPTMPKNAPDEGVSDRSARPTGARKPAAEPPLRERVPPKNPDAAMPSERRSDERTVASMGGAAAAPPGPASQQRSGPEPPFELRLTATARQVWVWLSVDGGPRQTLSLTRGESAVFRADHGYLLSIDDAGGIQASLNGEALPKLGESAQARRNLVIPSGELTPSGGPDPPELSEEESRTG